MNSDGAMTIQTNIAMLTLKSFSPVVVPNILLENTSRTVYNETLARHMSWVSSALYKTAGLSFFSHSSLCTLIWPGETTHLSYYSVFAVSIHFK